MTLKQLLTVLNEMANLEPQIPETREAARLVDMLTPCVSWREIDQQLEVEHSRLISIQLWAKDWHEQENACRAWSLFLFMLTLARHIHFEDITGY